MEKVTEHYISLGSSAPESIYENEVKNCGRYRIETYNREYPDDSTYMSKNRKAIPHKLYEGEMSDLGYKSEAEAVEYALKLFDAKVSKINIKILGHDLDYPK